MRVCVVGNSRHEHVVRWVRHFVTYGHQVHVASVWEGPAEGATHHRLGYGSSPMARRLLSYLKMASALRRLFDSIQPDLVQAHFTYTYGAATAWSGAHPYMLVTQGSDVFLPRWRDRVVRMLARYAVRHADAVLGSSAAQVTAARRLGARCPVYQLPFGVDLERFLPRAAEGTREVFRIGIFKALRPLYGHQELMEAFALVRRAHRDARLVIAGDGPLRRPLEARARELGIAEAVEFLGHVPHRDVPDVMAALDAVVLNSYSEGLPNMVLEAFAMGLPAIATCVGGVAEIVRDGKTGFTVRPGDRGQLAEAIARLIEDREACRQMGQQARAFVEANYDCRRSFDEMERLCVCLARGVLGREDPQGPRPG